jgi:hypothetical protein
VAGAVLAWATIGRAEPPPGIEVRWSAPAACPDVEEIYSHVRRLLPPGTPVSVSDRLEAEGTVVSIDGRYRLTLSVRRGGRPAGSPRVLESDSCSSLAGAAAVALAILARGGDAPGTDAPSPPTPSPPTNAKPPAPAGADTATHPIPTPPSATASPSLSATPPTSPPSPPASVVAKPPPPSPVDDEQTKPPRSWSLVAVGPFGVIDEGVLPSVAYGLGVGVGVRFHRFEFGIAGVLWLPQNAGSGAPGGLGGHFVRRSGEVSGCYAWALHRFELAPCLRLTLDDVSARGTGIVPQAGVVGGTGPEIVSESGNMAWLSVGASAQARWSPTRWMAVFISPGFAVATARPTFAVDGAGSVHRVPAATVGTELGWEWIF